MKRLLVECKKDGSILSGRYDFDDDFKLMMFVLEYTRLFLKESDDKLAKEWGYKDHEEIYNLLWTRFKYYKGECFNKQFSMVKSEVDCPRCHSKVFMAEPWPTKLLMDLE